MYCTTTEIHLDILLWVSLKNPKNDSIFVAFFCVYLHRLLFFPAMNKSRHNSCLAKIEDCKNIQEKIFYPLQCTAKLQKRRPALTDPLTKQEIEELRESYRLEQLRKVSEENGYKAMHPLALANSVL